jgi:hypothetical protein
VPFQWAGGGQVRKGFNSLVILSVWFLWKHMNEYLWWFTTECSSSSASGSGWSPYCGPWLELRGCVQSDMVAFCFLRALSPSVNSVLVYVKKTEVLVLRDRLGWHLVGLDVRRDTTLRALGLARLTRGLIRWTRHRWSRRRGTCRWSGSRFARRWFGEDEQHRIRWEPETRSGVEDFRRRCALVIGPGWCGRKS